MKHNNSFNIPFEIQYPSLKKIEMLRHRYVTLKSRLHRQHWKPFYEQAEKIIEWWGYLKYPNNPRELYIFKFEDGGLSHDRIIRHTPTHLRTLSFEKLGLLVNDEALTDTAMATLKGRFEGSIAQVPRNQALCDKYAYCDNLSSKFGGIIGECNEIIERYIAHSMHAKHPKEIQYSLDLVSTLTINERKYTALTKGHKTQIILYPEDSIHNITENDVLADEKDHPAIHGNSFAKLVTVNLQRRKKK